MTRIAHLTDLHFGAEDKAVVAALVAELNAVKPDLVVFSGDLTMGARKREFLAARAFMQAIEAPVLAVPGNHDISPYQLWERFFDPYRRWRRWVSVTEPSWCDDRVGVFGLNTARRFGLHMDWSRGRVTRVRLRRLLRRMEASAPGLVRVVVAHHPLLPPEDAPGTVVVGGARAALRSLAGAGVSLVLAGHLHRGYARVASGGGDAPLVLQGATATSVRLRGEPNAYNRVTIGADRKVVVEVRVWGEGGWSTKAAGGLPDPADRPVVLAGGIPT